MRARSKILLGFTALLAGTILVAESREQGLREELATSKKKNYILGTWRASLTFQTIQDNGGSKGPHPARTVGGLPPMDVLFSFAPGHTKNDGTVVDSNSFQLTPNPVCTQDQGVWQKVGDHSYIATHYAFCFDAVNDPGAPDGYVKVRDAILLSADGESISINQYVEGFDTQGTPNFTASGSGLGIRLAAEAPPAP